MEYKEYELGELIEYRNEKLLIENVSLENYISEHYNKLESIL